MCIRDSAKPATTVGLPAHAMLQAPRKAYVLIGVEPELDCWDGAGALKAMQAAELVIALSPYASTSTKTYAKIILPVGSFAETSGTYVNAEGIWQSFQGASKPFGAARPAWKVLRVLGNLCGCLLYTSSIPPRMAYCVWSWNWMAK